MTVEFVQISNVEDLNQWMERAERRTVVLFNHDPWCPISMNAYRQMREVDGEVALIDVSRERTVTREIAERTGVRHESPQVIVLRDGQVAWSASHFEISAGAVEEAARHGTSD